MNLQLDARSLHTGDQKANCGEIYSVGSKSPRKVEHVMSRATRALLFGAQCWHKIATATLINAFTKHLNKSNKIMIGRTVSERASWWPKEKANVYHLVAASSVTSVSFIEHKNDLTWNGLKAKRPSPTASYCVRLRDGKLAKNVNAVSQKRVSDTHPPTGESI